MWPNDKKLFKNLRDNKAPALLKPVSLFDLNGFSYFSSLIHWLTLWHVLCDIMETGNELYFSFSVLRHTFNFSLNYFV